jgi:outer membrane protein TolC
MSIRFAKPIFLGLIFANAFAQAEPISFDQAVKDILARDTQVHLADANKDAVVGENIYTRFHLLPKISFEGLTGSDYPGERITGATGTAQFDLFKFGADVANLDAARAAEQSARFTVNQTVLSEESVAITALLLWIRLQLESDVLLKLEKLQSDSVDVANREYRGGRVPLQEVQKAEVDLENVRSRMGEATVNLENAQQELVRLLGHSNVMIAWPWKDKIKALADPTQLEAKNYYDARPDFGAANLNLEAQEDLTKRAWRLMLPELDAKISYGVTRDTLYSNEYVTGWSALLLLEIPLFSRFADYSNYQYQKAVRNGAEYARDEVIRKMNSEFKLIPQRFLSARRTAIARENILEISNHLYQDNLSRYRLGRASSNELNIDLNRYLETELNAISGWALAHLAYTDLAHLTGKSAL